MILACFISEEKNGSSKNYGLGLSVVKPLFFHCLQYSFDLITSFLASNQQILGK